MNIKGIYNIWERKLNLFSGENKQTISEGIEFDDLSNPELDTIVGETAAETLREELELISEVYPEFNQEEYLNGDLQPVFFGSALNNFGVKELLDAFIEIAPSPQPKKAEELKALVGETVTEKGIGGEYAFELWKKHLAIANVPVDHPRNLAFVPAAPSRAAVMFDLVTSASSIHGAYWMEGAGGIFCENEAMRWIVSLTGLPEGAFGVFTSGGTAANLGLDDTQSNYNLAQEKRVKSNQLDAKLDYFYVINSKSNLNVTLGTTLSNQQFNSDVFQSEMRKRRLIWRYFSAYPAILSRYWPYSVLLSSSPRSRRVARPWAANASFNSITSIWSMVSPARASTSVGRKPSRT